MDHLPHRLQMMAEHLLNDDPAKPCLNEDCTKEATITWKGESA
jgi:hypothetical protein